jgi:hypothetical protein
MQKKGACSSPISIGHSDNSLVAAYTEKTNFRAIRFFNEADTLESRSILIYSFQEQSIFTEKVRHKAVLI